MSQQKKSPLPIHDLIQLAAITNIRGKAMTWVARTMKDHVNKHEIVTNDGKKRRTIYAPDPILKMMQTRLRENVLMRLPLPEYVHGFVPGKSLVSNAQQHLDSGLVVNIDLKDFFPSITAARVYGFWRWALGQERTKEAKTAAWAATNLTTFDGHLCQGFVTSPDIANHVAYKLDTRLAALAKSQSLRYTRYADDLTFSASAYDGDCKWLIDAVTEIATDCGFTVNNKKIAIMRKHRRQVVTGLIVNRMPGDVQRPRIPRYERRRIRAMCDKGKAMRSPEDRAEVEGWLAYMHSVNPAEAAKMRAMLESRIAGEKWTLEETQKHFRKKQERLDNQDTQMKKEG